MCVAEVFRSLIHFLLSAPPPLVRGWRRVPKVGYYAGGWWGMSLDLAEVCLGAWRWCL